AIEGRGQLEIAVARRESMVGIAVSDTGRGMVAEARRRAFEPFFSSRPGGTGLGLTIARRIADAHGGRIELESTPGRGTCMTILLPLAAADGDGEDPRRR